MSFGAGESGRVVAPDGTERCPARKGIGGQPHRPLSEAHGRYEAGRLGLLQVSRCPVLPQFCKQIGVRLWQIT